MRTKKRDNWQHFFSEPQAPSNYKPDTAAKYVENKRAQQEAAAHTRPYSGYVHSLAVVNHQGEQLLTVECGDGETTTASLRFIEMVTATPEFWVSKLELSRSDDIGVRWYGFNIKHTLPMIISEVTRYNGNEGKDNPVRVPVGLWWYPKFQQPPYEDPYDVLVPSGLRDDLDLHALCEFLSIPVPLDLATNPAAKASLARELALAGQMTVQE